MHSHFPKHLPNAFILAYEILFLVRVNQIILNIQNVNFYYLYKLKLSPKNSHFVSVNYVSNYTSRICTQLKQRTKRHLAYTVRLSIKRTLRPLLQFLSSFSSIACRIVMKKINFSIGMGIKTNWQMIKYRRTYCLFSQLNRFIFDKCMQLHSRRTNYISLYKDNNN